ncbi:MAG: hypothetical protein KJ990_00345 [Proteobacteria bacterium]|nr:hypothetical protein [Pseudomonadota bacterium]MBU1648377.1 hypothetical protein [Pseudomonadota bacterium]
MKILQSRALLILLICLSCPTAAGAETLGRLFFTPQDRVYLEQLRWASPESLPLIPEQQEEKVMAPDSKPAVITLGGTVTRSDGAQIVWLNGVSYNGADLPANVRVSQPFISGQVELREEQKGTFYLLRPGQTLDVDSGQVSESYEHGAGLSVPGNATPEDPGSQELPVEESIVSPKVVPAQNPASSLPVK